MNTFHMYTLLTQVTVKAMAVAIVRSRLDYCNGVLYGNVTSEHKQATESAEHFAAGLWLEHPGS